MTKRTPPFSAEVREHAVRLDQEHKGEHSSLHAAIRSIAAKIGCSGGASQDPWPAQQVRVASGGESLRNWIQQAERDKGSRAGPTTDERERIKAPKRENRKLRQTNEILCNASAYFAMKELDRRSRP